MRMVFVLLLLICTALSARAENTAAPLPTRMDLLTAARLDAAIAKIKNANTLIEHIKESVAPSWKVVNEVTTKYKLQLTDAQGRTVDSINFDTGEITRAAPPPESTAPPAPSTAVAPQPTTPKPEKPAKK